MSVTAGGRKFCYDSLNTYLLKRSLRRCLRTYREEVGKTAKDGRLAGSQSKETISTRRVPCSEEEGRPVLPAGRRRAAARGPTR